MNNQAGLFDAPTPPPAPPGRHEKLLTDALEIARSQGHIQPMDAALVSLALANAWGLDQIEASGKVSLLGNVTGPYQAVLEKLHLTPTDRGGEATDAFAKAVALLRDE